MRYAVFGGTTEGRILCEYLKRENKDFTVFTATKEGADILSDDITVRYGRLEKAHMEKELSVFDIVIDATHPYAKNVTENIKYACKQLGRKYIRILRDERYCKNALYFNSIDEAVIFLNKQEGKIFVSTGSNDAYKYTKISGYENRIVIRILNSNEALEKCSKLGFKNILCGLGPFSTEENIRDFKGCSWLVTKSSGKAGGFEEKIKAAENLGMKTVVIKRPDDEGVTLEEAVKMIERQFITEPSEIERRSMAIIEEKIKDKNIDEKNKDVVKRVIHTTADFDYADNLVFSENAVDIFIEKLKNGANIVTDTNMALAGINKRVLNKLGVKAYCFMADDDVAKEASERGITRAAVSVEKASKLEGETIFVVGNAPTSLIAIDRLLSEGKLYPSLIVGVPVGFVNVVESKKLIMEGNIPYIVSKGNKGGSTVAAAIVNAVLYKIGR